jgi:acetolactate synthase-1/2/3 large subunit|tara:strand:+ start:5768 stop:7570 length:1803 start_codon:yes stop_codon:yes gene_type:complete
MRVADYIFKYLADYGIEYVFLVTGGGAMHLNDALKRESRIKYFCNYHEQGAAIAAEGYARTKGSLAVVTVSSGPAVTNALTGVIGQWLDSVPVLYLSGQVKYETTTASDSDISLRQLGDQEINVINMVNGVTKYAKMITEPESIKQELDIAVNSATSGRPGPVWLDIPLNVQGALINELNLNSNKIKNSILTVKDATILKVINEIQKAKRPVLVAGHGIRIAKAEKKLLKLVDLLNIPVLSTFNGFDLISSQSDNFIGRIGTLGSRAGNFALQNTDLAIFLGTRNNIRQVSYDWISYARNAKKIIVDIDYAELHKKTIKGDILIQSDAKVFISKLSEMIPKSFSVNKIWKEWCLVRKKKYPVVLDEYKIPNQHSVNPYYFIEKLTTILNDDAVVVAANGSACVVLFQAGKVKFGQRFIWNSGCASMGYALPASIGASLAVNREVICITGDGSIQMNLQELQAIKHHNLPIKIFVLNNDGYSSIKLTQTQFFSGNFIGCNEASGISFPDNSKLAELYNLKYYKIDSSTKMAGVIKKILSYSGAVLCEVMLVKNYAIAPKLTSEKKPDGSIVSKPLEDLYPFLERDEFRSNMIINDKNEEDV